MKNITLLFFLIGPFLMGQSQVFGKKALEEVMISENGTELMFSDILNTYKGEPVFIDVWASWCKDCIVSQPKINALRKKYGDKVKFVFISLDKSKEAWKKAIAKFNIKGDHYFIPKKWKDCSFCEDIELDWIPRYILINTDGQISLYKAIEVNDRELVKQLKSI